MSRSHSPYECFKSDRHRLLALMSRDMSIRVNSTSRSHPKTTSDSHQIHHRYLWRWRKLNNHTRPKAEIGRFKLID